MTERPGTLSIELRRIAKQGEPMEQQTLADAVCEYLISKNVRDIFGVLAHTLFPFGDAIAKRPQLRFINAQHEGGAGNMALGYARVTKQPAVCLVSAGG